MTAKQHRRERGRSEREIEGDRERGGGMERKREIGKKEREIQKINPKEK